MSQIVALSLLLVVTVLDWPKILPNKSAPNQRIEELQNRHDRRFRAQWAPRSPSRSRPR